MKKKSVVILVLIVAFLQANAKKIEGYIILNNDEKVNVTFLMPFGLFSVEPSYEKLQTRVRYIDGSGRKIVLRPSEAKEISFMSDGKRVRMLSVKDDLQLGSVFSSQEKIFLKLEIDGKVRLFNSYFTQTSPGMYNSTTGMATGGYMYNVEKYVLQKDNSVLMKPRGISFRKDMSEFFSDCPELVQKIQNKDLKKGDLELIVREYNDKCAD